MSKSSSQCRRPGIDLQLCLLHLPTPVIAICQSRTVTFANRAAEALLNHESQIQSTNGFIGRQLAELDISLLYNETWESALDKLDSAQRFSQDDIAGTGTEVREVVAVVGKPGSEGRSRHFRVLISSLAGRDETSHVLSFELSSNIKSVPTVGSSAALDGTAVPENEAGTAEFHDTQRYKAATFDDSKVAGFIISSDAKFYIPNKKTKEIFGDSIGDPHKHHYPYTKCAEFWNEQFTDKVRDDLLPGLRIARTRKPYKDYRYGLRVIPTGERYILNSSGECLYDNAGQFIGGVCWFTSFQKLSGFVACERQKDLRSHETICNLLPHMVWTTAADGITSDWFSKRWFDYTGMTEEEASGTGFAKAFHPDDCPHIFKVLEKHNVSKEEFQIQMRFRRHDGCYRYMIARAAPILDENGELLRWYGTNTDIHEATVARLQADFIKDQIMAVLAHTDVSLFAIDRERSITMSEGRTIDVVALVGEGAPSDFVGMNAIELARALDLPGSAS
jgi:PAS domain S-box-containing protein